MVLDQECASLADMETATKARATVRATGMEQGMIYLIGSLRNPEVSRIAQTLRSEGFEVFDDWYAAGPEADDKWRDYEKGRGHSYLEGLNGLAAENVYTFDRRNLDRSQAAVLVCPAGKSGHLELGYVLGRGSPGYILLEPGVERWDVMYKFATGVFENVEQLVTELKGNPEHEAREARPRVELVHHEFGGPTWVYTWD